jgi:hypothetical protein
VRWQEYRRRPRVEDGAASDIAGEEPVGGSGSTARSEVAGEVLSLDVVDVDDRRPGWSDRSPVAAQVQPSDGD